MLLCTYLSQPEERYDLLVSQEKTARMHVKWNKILDLFTVQFMGKPACMNINNHQIPCVALFLAVFPKIHLYPPPISLL